jgi:hypothetical protein
MAKARVDPYALKVDEYEVTIEGTAPIVLLPLGFFKDCPEDEDGQLQRALELYCRDDGEPGFPAGAIKESVIQSLKGVETKARQRIVGGFHVIGEEATNKIRLLGDPQKANFEFNFKKPERVVTKTLPQIDEWSCVFTAQVVRPQMTKKSLTDALNKAGEKVGIGHRRPEMGTFSVKTVKKIK